MVRCSYGAGKNYIAESGKMFYDRREHHEAEIKSQMDPTKGFEYKIFLSCGQREKSDKLIKEITSLEGVNLTESKDIQEEIVKFYKSLMGSSAKELPAINRMNMKDGPTLSHQQKLDLIAPVYEEEIQRGLESIGEDKAPGIDGYNATFFKKIMGYH